MSRQPRLNVADGVYHVTQRGPERRGIVLDEDRHDWWRLFDRQATRCGWRVFALALLDNHFHIFLRTQLRGMNHPEWASVVLWAASRTHTVAVRAKPLLLA